MRIHVEHQGRGEEQAKGRILGRILAVVTAAVLLCLFATWGVAAQVNTETTVSFPVGPFVVGQSVTVTWTVDAQTDSFTFAGGTLERSLWDPDGASLNPGNVTVTGSDPFTRTYAFTANKPGDYTAGGTYTGCPTCTPVVNGSSAADKTLTVSKRSTSTAVIGPAAAVVGEPLTFTVDVNDTSAVGTLPSLAGDVVWTVTLPGPSTATLNGTVDSFGDGTISYSPPVTGSYTIEAAYQGNASYATSASSPATSFAVDERPTSLEVTGASTAVVAEPVTVTATVSDATSPPVLGSPSFSGTVTWSTGSGTGSFNNASCTVSPAGVCSVIYTPASGDIGSTVTITARYDDDPNYGISTGTHDVDVSQRTTSAVITVPTAPLYVNEPLTFSAQVSDGQVGTGTSPSLAGSVTWKVTYTPTATGTPVTETSSGETVNVNGYGEYIFIPPYASSELTAGYAITAEYTGNTDYAASDPDGSDTFTVVKRTTSAAITVPTAPLYVNEPLTFSVQVSDDQVGTGTSPGFNGTADLVTWTVTPPSGTPGNPSDTVDATGYGEIPYTPSVVSSAADDFSITAEYAGNAYYIASDPDGEDTFTVDERPTSMSVTGNASAYVNEAVDVKATVSDDSGASGSPNFTGTVTWTHSGSGAITSCTVDGSTGECEVTYTPVEADAGTTVTLTARYDTDTDNTNGNDDPNYGISDGSHGIAVSQRSTTTAIAVPPFGSTPSVAQSVQFEATVTDDIDSSNVTTGSLSFTVTLPDSSSFGPISATYDSGLARWKASYTPAVAGTFHVRADYAGDNTNGLAASASTQVAFTVNKRATSTSVAPMSPWYVNHTGTFSLTVQDASGLGNSPSLDGNVSCTVTLPSAATVVLAGSVADTASGTASGAVSYTPLSAGSYSVVATYQGNPAYSTSSSGASPGTSFSVSQRPTSVSVTGPASAYVHEPVVYSASVADATDDGTGNPLPGSPSFTGQIAWTPSGWSSTPCSVDPMGECSSIFTPTTVSTSVTITATYPESSDPNYGESSGTIGLSVNRRPTNTTITGPVPSGADHDFTVTVVDASGAGGTPPDPTGYASWSAPGATPASGLTPLSGGTCTFTVTPPGGNYTVTVNYVLNGDANYNVSNSSLLVESGKRTTSTTISGPADPVCLCQTVQLTATVMDESGIASAPGFTGTVDWTTNGSGTLSCDPCDIPHGGQVVMSYTTNTADVGSIIFTASYSGDANYNESNSSAFSLEVIQRATRTDVSAQPGTVYVNETTSLSATMTDLATDCCGACATPPDSDAVTFSRKAGSPGTGTVNNTADTYTPTGANTDQETHIIRGEYLGNSTYEASAGEVGVDVKKREVAVQVEVGTADPAGSGGVPGTFAPVSSVYIHELVFLCITVRDVTPAGHGASPAYAFSGDTVVVDDLGRNGEFLASSHTFINSDQLSSTPAVYRYFVPYIPKAGDAGTTTLAATYQGSSVYEMQPGGTTLGVEARPTTISVSCDPDPVFVDQRTKCTITVQDVGPTASSTVPTGAIHLTTSGDGHFYETSSFSDTTVITDMDLEAADGGSVDVYYEAETANAAQDTHILSTHYIGSGDPPDATTQVHADSSGNVALTVKLRKTTTTISLSSSKLTYTTTSPMSSTVTVTVEDVSPGDKSSPGGKLMLEAPGGGGHFDYLDSDPTYDSRTGNGTSLLTLRWNSFDNGVGVVDLEARAYYRLDEKTVPVHPILAVFEPTDGKHLASADGKQIEVEVDGGSYPSPDPSTAPAGTGDVISCGLIGGNWATDIFNFRHSLLAYTDILKIMDMGATVLQLIPDVLVDVTDPAWSVIHLIFQGAMVDLDGDGIPGLFELGYVWAGLSDFNRDVDGDGIPDYAEIAMAGGQFYPTVLDTTISWSRPNPTHPDSDRDGLSDGDEVYTFLTNCCDPDTDDDGLTDGQEIASGLAFDATGYESVALPDPSPRNDVRDHADPWVQDTDGDGLNDALEFEPGSLSFPYSTFVNDPDSDGDGLLDGVEDSDFSGSTSYTLGRSNSEGSGETHPCIADTDGDGLTDGEEEGLFGRGSVEVSTPTGTITVPALDDDSDNDGLSDYEEQIVTGTDPLNWDTDGDGLSDADELIVIGGNFPNRSFRQESDPLDPDTDDDGLGDKIEYYNATTGQYGSGVIRTSGDTTGEYGDPDTICPYVNDDDSDDDGLQDGYEVGSDGVWEVTRYGNSTQDGIGETCACNPDTDNDGLLDGEEEGLFGQGSVDVVFRGGGTSSTVPALDVDCDRDGLSDYEEVHVTMTNPLHWDTDGDSISDANELIATTAGTFPVFSETTNTDGVARTFYQESDPLDTDTDDDLLLDTVEYDGTRLGDPTSTYWLSDGGDPDTVCPYVNDDDSDDDGLQDGIEDADRDGAWNPLTTGNSATQKPQGETNLCDCDTDDDGLTDGEEVALFGGLPVDTSFPHYLHEVLTTAGDTIPALDDDSDNDGLSDYEEVNITGTDPLDADTDGDTISDANELIAISQGTTPLGFPIRTFDQESDPLDIDTDDDGLTDNIEWDGSGLGITRVPGGTRDLDCPYVNDDDSDHDGLQDGVEDANHDGVWGVKGDGPPTVGDFATQAAPASDDYYETNLCDCDTDGDGLLDGEEVALIGGGPVLGRPATWPANQPFPGFHTVTPEGVSTVLPLGTGPAGSPPGTGNSQLGPYTFIPIAGAAMTTDKTVPALDMDSDNDGLSDYEEVNITGTDPLDQDTDNDTLMDSDELIATGGGWPNRTFDQESDPLDINTDDDHLFDPQEYYNNAGQYGSGLGSSPLLGGLGGARDICPYVNDDDSDDDGLQDGLVVSVDPQTSLGYDYSYTHYEDFVDIQAYSGLGVDSPGYAKVTVSPATDYEQYDDTLQNVCDCDSDGDGLYDGEEVAIGTDPDDWDTDDDGRSDWHEHTGGGPIPTDPFDPDTDDDGLTDSVEVFGLNPTNPVNADTDGDGLCDGGTGTPWMISGDARVIVNPICKSCSDPGLASCGTLTRSGSVDGIGDHPNPHGYGEDKDGDGTWDGTIGQKWVSGAAGTPETDPNQYDTDGDAEGDGIEVLGFSTSRQYMIPPVDIFGRPITVVYPACGCLEPLILDTDGDGLTDGYEDRNHDGNFDFLPSEFDHQDPLPGPPIPYPTETNPCDPDTDHDELTDWEERNQRQPLLAYPDLPLDNDGDGLIDEDPVDGIDNDLDGLIDEDPPEGPIELTFNPTNPLDHDTDNDWIYDGPEVYWVCVAVTYAQLDNDGDALIDEDWIDGLDNDGDGLIDEDPVDFFVRFVPMLDPTNRDSDSDGFIDGLDDDPCNSELIPLLPDVQIEPVDTDGDGFSDDDEIMAGTHPNDPEDYPAAYCKLDLDFDQAIDDRMWLERRICCGIANSVVIDIDSNVLIDARVQIVQPRDVKQGDFDGDGAEDDFRYVVEYAFSNYRVVQPRIVLTIYDYNGDLVIDHAEVVRK